MMRLFLPLLLSLILVVMTPGMAHASAGTTPPTTPPTTPTVPGGQCDYSALANSLYETESAGCRDYQAICDMCSGGGTECSARARGKYQFIPDTRERYCAQATECGCGGGGVNAHCNSQEGWISGGACNDVQECIMNAYMNDSRAALQRPACQELLSSGRSFPGTLPDGRPCVPTESGIMAAMHLGGNGGEVVCNRLLAGGGTSDSNGTSLANYMCRHGGLPIPGNCTPGTWDPNVALPPATLIQLESPLWPEYNRAGGDPAGLLTNVVRSLMQMAEQFTAAMIAQMNSLGMLLDAKHQQETQRLMQEKVAEAHKDYQPSEQMCTFGTFARELAATERSADMTRNSLSTHLMQREINSGESLATTPVADSLSRIANYRAHFCNQADNSNGLALLCPTPADPAMRNRDINYTLTVDAPLSLDVNLLDAEVTDDERAIFALVDNLFAHQPLPNLPASAMDQPKFQYHYMNVRSLVAMRGVVRSTIANVIALKTASPQIEDSNAPYLSALFREFGITDAEITLMLGERPSYYAQMELLTKKIYQNPTFYTNLYDKPTNVKRIRAAMTAIKLMQDRDIAASLQRREMLLSIMLELRLRNQAQSVYSATERALFDED